MSEVHGGCWQHSTMYAYRPETALRDRQERESAGSATASQVATNLADEGRVDDQALRVQNGDEHDPYNTVRAAPCC